MSQELTLDLDLDLTPPSEITGIKAADSSIGKDWALYLGDSCQVIQSIPDCSVDMSIHSPPFANLYIYSDSEADMGNCETTEEFLEHYKFLIREMLRIHVVGRVACVHCKDLPKYANRDDTAGLIDFPGQIVRAYEECGWSYHSRVTIWKCPVLERERTNNNGLLHKTAERDRSQLRQGMADFLLVFRKAPVGTLMSVKPVVGCEKDHEGRIIREGFIEPYVGELSPRKNDLHPSRFARKNNASEYSIDIWRRYADPAWFDLADPMHAAVTQLLPTLKPDQRELFERIVSELVGEKDSHHWVWWDIKQADVLNGKSTKSDQDEKHICPLQVDLIRRSVQIWSNPSEVIFTPFAGIGSELYGALLEDRRAVGIELKKSYFNTAITNCRVAEEKKRQRRLF